jgi:hypothetical protein
MNPNAKQQMVTREGSGPGGAEQRFKELGIRLPEPPEPFGVDSLWLAESFSGRVSSKKENLRNLPFSSMRNASLSSPVTGFPDLPVTMTGTRTRPERAESVTGACGGAADCRAHKGDAIVEKAANNRARWCMRVRRFPRTD